MNGAFLRRRDRTVRSLRVEHYSSAVNTSKRYLLIHESPLTDALFLLVSKSDEVTTT